MTNATTAERRRQTLVGRGARLLPRRRGPRLTALAALVVLAAGSAYGVHAWANHAGAAEQLTVATVQRGNLEDTVTATGILQPREYVDVGTQVSGQLKKLHVEIGSPVKAGQLIAEIDPTVYHSRASRRTRRSCARSRPSSWTSRRSSRLPTNSTSARST